MKFKTITIIFLSFVAVAYANKTQLKLPGVTADSKTKRVIIEAKATGLAENTNTEFLLIHENSGHDYEAIAMTSAKPSDIHKALEFIGMTPGKPANMRELRFWPRGERVIVTVCSDGVAPAKKPVRAEKLIIDKDNNDKTLAESGYVFTGSTFITTEDQPDKKIYAADDRGPQSIIAQYNESCSVMDVPRHASKGTVYSSHFTNPEYVFTKEQPLTITIEPEYKDGKKRELDLNLKMDINPENKEEDLANTLFTLSDDKKTIDKNQTLENLLKSFVKITKNGQSPFITLTIADRVPLGTVQKMTEILISIETENGIRMEPPAEDHLYFKAFLPDERNRKREDRISQPWELTLTKKEGKVEGVLTSIEQIWKDGRIKPDLNPSDYNVKTPQELRKALDSKEKSIPVILVFAAKSITHGELMTFIKPALPTHGMIHVYLDE